MSRKREFALLAAGLLTGLALRGPAAQAADYLKATLSTQPVCVNGQQVQLESYLIHGNNFVKLRDIGKTVGFNVYWDGAAVQIETEKPYTGKAPMAVSEEHTQTENPNTGNPPVAVSEESVLAALDTLRARYPHGSVYPAPYTSTSGGPYGTSASNCAGWAVLCSDAAFGALPWRRVERPAWEQIRPGDLIEVRSSQLSHGMIVLERTEEYIEVTESGTDQKVLWGGQYFRWWLEQQPAYVLYTRYPA